jgi:acetyl-CoA carboxylase carboxyltransferase component
MTQEAVVLIAGPAVVRRAIGTDHTKEELGGPQVHLYSGVIDNVAANEAEALEQVRVFLSYLPDNVGLPPVVTPNNDSPSRADPELDHSVSILNRRQIYDMRDIVARIFDADSIFEMSPFYGPGIITALARLNGHPVGIIANDCAHFGGSMTADGARKLTKFLAPSRPFPSPRYF